MILNFINKTDIPYSNLSGFSSNAASMQCRGSDCDCWEDKNCNCDCNCVCDCDDCNCICDCDDCN